MNEIFQEKVIKVMSMIPKYVFNSTEHLVEITKQVKELDIKLHNKEITSDQCLDELERMFTYAEE